MHEVVIVEAVRSPLGKRKGGLSSMHSMDLLGEIQSALFERSGVDPAEVGQVIGGCVGQVGMQTMNVARNAWLTAGLPLEVAATTVDAPASRCPMGRNSFLAAPVHSNLETPTVAGVYSSIRTAAARPTLRRE